MTKTFALLALLFSLSYARMISGIAMTVDNEPITLLEIKTFQKLSKLSKEESINALIQKKLEAKAIKENGIFVSDHDVDEETEMFAKRNGIDLAGLKAGLQKQGVTMSRFKSDLREKLKRDKLYKKILAGRLQKADDEALKAYYKAHKKEFKLPGNIKVIKYTAKDGRPLQALQMQPMMRHDGVKMREVTVDATKANPKLFGLLMQTPESKFTQIINMGKEFVTFFIKQKGRDRVVAFEKAKQNIFGMLMKEQEQALLMEFFEKKRSEAIVKVIRKP